MLASFQASGDYNASICTGTAKQITNQAFANFQVFIQKEFADQSKNDKATAKSSNQGIANKVTFKQDKQQDPVKTVDTAEVAVSAIAEVANTMHQAQAKQMEQFMEIVKTMRQAQATPTARPNNSNQQANSNQQTCKKCSHCKKTHWNHGRCWELENNMTKCPANWKCVKDT